MFAGKKSAQIREILISESAWEEMTCLFAPSLARSDVSQIKRVYDEMSPGEGDKFVRTIKENTQIRMNLKK